VSHILDRGAKTDARGAVQELDRVAQVDARGGAQVIDRCAQAAFLGNSILKPTPIMLA
jgi:hypothetical protein